LVRKSSVCTGNPDWNQSAGTTTANSEWIVYPIDTWTYLGSHIGCVTVDTVPPVALQAYPTSPNSVTVIFNEGVNATANNAANYTGLGAISNVYHPVDGDTVILTLSTPLTNGTQSTLTIVNVEDLSGNAMTTPQDFTFLFNNTIADVVITEIMYNVPSYDTLEFIEVYNNGNATASIGGYYFSLGVIFEFPANTMINAGEYLIVAINASGVDNFFGISGSYEWADGSGLNNSGEEIEISNTVGDVIAYVDYDDQTPWPISPDGGGPSLTFCDPALDNNNPANWSASVELAGVLSSGDTIWATPKAGCFAPPPLVADFLANNFIIPLGSTIALTDLSSGGPANWEWIFDGGVPMNSTLQNPTAIQYLSIGTYDVTLIVTNANDSDTLIKTDYITVIDSIVADIVITEIMYNPPETFTDSLEFIELYNNGASVVNLLGYAFTLGVDFIFPSVDLNPGDYIVISVDSIACLNTFGITAFQWTSGGLSNGGEPIELVNDVGLVVDFVHYDDNAPWPTEPDGDGPSLTFCDPALDNNDPLNWTASTEFAGVNSAGDTIWATPGAGCDLFFTLSGNLIYDNTSVTPLNNSTVYLKDKLGNILDSTITDISGYYTFNGLLAGDFVLDASTTKAWGGANSTDALGIMQHFVSQIILTGLRLKVADVSATGYVNSVDALRVQQRFILLISQFPSGDWGFENDTFNVSANVVKDFHGLCFGDVNGSFTPLTKKSPGITLYQDEVIEVSSAKEMELAVNVDVPLNVGAVSLIINYPQNNVEVLGVEIPGSDNANLMYSANNGQLIISWFDLKHVQLSEGEALLILKIKTIGQNEEISFTLEGISELADEYANVIENVNLYIPKLRITEDSEGFALGQNYPNPFSNTTEIEIILPEAGHVSIDIFDTPGKLIMSVLNGQMEKGFHKISVDGTDLAEGMYVYKIVFNGHTITNSVSKRMLIAR
ncbi:MAG: lamin tail domain-containing protein, partial [Bacteroidales bacterium]|nr:lamin tail domain-containing protein [Bacteroidales bacterium]